MCIVTFDDKILLELNENGDRFAEEVRLASATWFYSQHKLTIGQAAELADMTVHDFMIHLGNHKISCIDYPAGDLIKEVNLI